MKHLKTVKKKRKEDIWGKKCAKSVTGDQNVNKSTFINYYVPKAII